MRSREGAGGLEQSYNVLKGWRYRVGGGGTESLKTALVDVPLLKRSLPCAYSCVGNISMLFE